MAEQQQEKHWAIVDLFGHRRIAGQVSEFTLGGQFIRVDVPAVEGREAFTRLIGPSAVYEINFVSEEIARAVARRSDAAPVSAYDLPRDVRQAIEDARERKATLAPVGTSEAELEDEQL